MKNRKEIMAALMAMIMCVSFTACNKDTEGDTSSVENTSSEAPVASESSVAEESSVEDSNSENDEDVLFPISDEIKNASLSDGLVQIGNDVFRCGGYMTISEFAAKYSTENGGNWDMTWKPAGVTELDDEMPEEMAYVFASSHSVLWEVTNTNNEIGMNLCCTEPVDGTGTWGDMVIVMFEYRESYNPETHEKYEESDVVRAAGPSKNIESGDEVIAFYQEQGLEETTYDDNFFREENAGKYIKHTSEGYQDETIYGVVKSSEPNLYGYEPVFLYGGSEYLHILDYLYKDDIQ